MVNFRSRRSGAVLPLIAVFIAAFLFIAALTINSNWFMFNRTNAQNTADISARAALQQILVDPVADGRIGRARDLGARLYDLNIARKASAFTPERIRFGTIANFQVDDPEFVETFDDNSIVSAVHVDSPIQEEQQNVEVFFAKLLGSAPSVKIFADATTSTRPIDVMLCLDASRSMNRRSDSKKLPPGATSIHEKPLPGSRWFELTDTVETFLAALREINPNARVGLVTFGGGATWRKEPLSLLDDDLARLEQGLTVVVSKDVEQIPSTMKSYVEDNPALGLGTSLYDGIKESERSFLNDTDSSKHIVMLSDGQQAAVERPDPILAAQDARAENITIHTIFFGADRGKQAMEDIATETKGSTFTAVSEDELKEAFSQLLGRFRVQLVD